MSVLTLQEHASRLAAEHRFLTKRLKQEERNALYNTSYSLSVKSHIVERITEIDSELKQYETQVEGSSDEES